MSKTDLLRPAIAMIELIFAIVVIGITLLSAPLVLNQSIQSNTVAIQQESIAAAATQISLIMTQNWDENDSNASTGYGILNTAIGHANLANGARDLNTTYSSRSFNINPLYTNAAAPADFGLFGDVQDGGVIQNADDIDDFDGEIRHLRLYATESEEITEDKGEYIDQDINMTTTIRYGRNDFSYGNDPLVANNPFISRANSTNIKLISVRLTSNSGIEEYDKTVVLSAFTCNIGTPTITPGAMK